MAQRAPLAEAPQVLEALILGQVEGADAWATLV